MEIKSFKKMKEISNELIEEFLKESNAIEREYSDEALEDSKDAWALAMRNNKEITIDFICKIHRQLLKTINPHIAGKLRKVEVQVGFRVCMPSKVVESHLKELCSKIPNTEEEIKEWHILFEHIHPFEDGNGRVGRIIMNIQRLKIGLPLLIIHTGKEQKSYYGWFY